MIPKTARVFSPPFSSDFAGFRSCFPPSLMLHYSYAVLKRHPGVPALALRTIAYGYESLSHIRTQDPCVHKGPVSNRNSDSNPLPASYAELRDALRRVQVFNCSGVAVPRFRHWRMCAHRLGTFPPVLICAKPAQPVQCSSPGEVCAFGAAKAAWVGVGPSLVVSVLGSNFTQKPPESGCANLCYRSAYVAFLACLACFRICNLLILKACEPFESHSLRQFKE